MTNKATQNYRCSQCHQELRSNQNGCPVCGNVPRDIHISVSEEIKIQDNIKLRSFISGTKKFIIESITGWFPSNRKDLSPDGVNKEQVVDRRNNKYKKKIVDVKTGRIIKDIEENLTDHR